MITCENIWGRYECLTLKESVLPIQWPKKKKSEDTAGINNSRWFIYRALKCMVLKKIFPRAAAAWHSTRPVPGSRWLSHRRLPLFSMLYFLLRGQQLLSFTLFSTPRVCPIKLYLWVSVSVMWVRLTRGHWITSQPHHSAYFISDVLPIADKQFNIHSFINI